MLTIAVVGSSAQLVSSETQSGKSDCLTELADVVGADRTLMREWLELLRGPETFNEPMTSYDWRTFFIPIPNPGSERERLHAELIAEKKTCESKLAAARAKLRRLAELVVRERERSAERFSAFAPEPSRANNAGP